MKMIKMRAAIAVICVLSGLILLAANYLTIDSDPLYTGAILLFCSAAFVSSQKKSVVTKCSNPNALAAKMVTISLSVTAAAGVALFCIVSLV